MKQLGELLVQQDPFKAMAMGNTAIVRGMVEAGTKVVSSYPGSPTPEIASAINTIPPDQRPFYFEFSVNEKTATEVAFGAALNGNLSTVFFKSVGLNVALDSFVQLGLMNIPGGMIVVIGDDPGANSSQNEQDNRNIFTMARTPVLEPASPTEVYQYYLKAARLTQAQQTVVVLRLTTHVCHGREKVAFGAYSGKPAPSKSDFNSENGPYIPIAALALEMKRASLKKLPHILDFFKVNDLNTIWPTSSPQSTPTKGIITQGLTFLSVKDVLHGVTDPPDILKLGAIYPLDIDLIAQFLKAHQEVLILEELDDIHERQIKAVAFDRGISVKIIGKTSDEDFIGEYTPDKVNGILSRVWPTLIPPPVKSIGTTPDILLPDTRVPHRPAQMCPGCGHRSAFHAIKQALEGDDITVADIGCHTLGFMPPYQMGEVLLCMGASPGIASGLSLFNDKRRVIAFLGDSTFFHAGLPGLMNTLFNRHNITIVIMENGTTAMTGHQDHAGKQIPIESLLKGMGIEHIFSCDTYQQAKLMAHMENAMAVQGLSAVIAKHPCMLKFMREQKKRPGYTPKHVMIDQTQCSPAHTCVETFGCPSFVRHSDNHITVNRDLCIGDGSCRQVCAAKAIVPEKEEKQS